MMHRLIQPLREPKDQTVNVPWRCEDCSGMKKEYKPAPSSFLKDCVYLKLGVE